MSCLHCEGWGCRRCKAERERLEEALRSAVRKWREAMRSTGPWLVDFTTEEREAWEAA